MNINGVDTLQLHIDVIEKINKMWGAKKCREFPGPQPISIERKHFSVLQSTQYMVGIKNDGERYALCFFTFDDKNVCALINRKLETFALKVRCNTQCFAGTIIDCELVNNTIVCFDATMINGSVVKSQSFIARLNACKTFCDALACNKFPFRIECKTFVPLQDVNTAIENSKCESSDGLIFVPLASGIIQGTHSTMFKWKPKIKNTIDFAILNNKVHLQNAGVLSCVKVKIDHTLTNTDKVIIVECEYVAEKHWKAIGIREDKLIPNSKYTYQRTLVNIIEDIQTDEFVKR